MVGKIVKFCEKESLELVDLSLKQLQKFSPLIGKDIFNVLGPEASVKARTGLGQTSPASVIKQANIILDNLKKYGFKK